MDEPSSSVGAVAAAGHEEELPPRASARTSMSYSPQHKIANYKVVKELSIRYEKQQRRWQNYTKLFGFFIFAVLFLTVLWLQRGAQRGYAVFSTIKMNVLDKYTTGSINAAVDVVPWLREIANNHWVDPACGDGKCSQPFEFPSYSRFGCRADCSTLSAVLTDLYPLQIDLYFDFAHSTDKNIVSLRPTSLMELAAWNVCPEDAPHGKDCLYEEDQRFQMLKGHITEVIEEAPPGNYTLVIKRDYFNKIKGAVRNMKAMVKQARQYTRINLALKAAAAGWQFETTSLQGATAAARAALADKVLEAVEEEYDVRLAAIEANRNVATVYATDAEYTAALTALNGTLSKLQQNINTRRHHPVCQQGLEDFNLPAMGQVPADVVWNHAVTSTTPNLNAVKWANSTITTQATDSDCTSVSSVNICECGRLATYFAEVEKTRFTGVVDLIVNRLDPERKTTMRTKSNQIIQQMADSSPELVPYMSQLTRGASYDDRENLKLEDLYTFYFQGPDVYGSQGTVNVADEDLKYQPVTSLPGLEGTLQDRLETRAELVDRINARLAEVAAIKSTVDALPEVERVKQQLETGTLLHEAYNKRAFYGGRKAYQSCNIGKRAPEYAGTCVPAVPYTLKVETDVSNPYDCQVSTAPDVNTTTQLTGIDCTRQVDKQLDCDQICICDEDDVENSLQQYLGCNTARSPVTYVRYCRCPVCAQLMPADQEPQFGPIRELAQEALLGGGAGRRRRLQQTTEEAQLTSLKASVDKLVTSQASLKDSVTTLTTSVDTANTKAEARAADTTIKDLIAAGQAQIEVDQARTEQLLTEIIGKQNQALELAATSQTSLAAIVQLTESALSTLENIERKFDETLSAIKLAVTARIIDLPEALNLWKRARRNRLSDQRDGRLINLPCTYVASTMTGIGIAASSATTVLSSSYNFTVEGELPGLLDSKNALRERWIGTNNRIIGGMLINVIRLEETECTNTRFPNIQNVCKGDYVSQSYGVDPTFKTSTDSFDPDLSAADMLSIYDCERDFGTEAEYDVEHPTIPGVFVNERPYCTQYFNTQNIPYGFVSLKIPGHARGYPIWLDNNLSAEEANRWITYLVDGLYFDTAIESMTFELVTYNSEIKLFAKLTMLVQSSSGGAYLQAYNLDTVKVEVYERAQDYVQLLLEILLTALVALAMLHQLYMMMEAHKHEGSFLAYYTGGFDILDLLSTMLMVATISMWWAFVWQASRSFHLSNRYFVYKDFRADAHLTRLSDSEGSELIKAARDFERMDELLMMLGWYYALNGINILIMIARVLHLMHFHPRLGVVTRSLVVALPDLFNFLLVGGVMFLGYAMMGHLIFGATVEKFQTFGKGIVTCLEVIMGDLSVNEQLRVLPGLMNTVGQLYFWSFELVVFMVLLNFLLAIIVDSFCEVKEATVHTTSVFEDVGDLLRVRWADTKAAFFGTSKPGATHVGINDMGKWLKRMAFTLDEMDTTEDPSMLPGSDSRVLRLGLVKLTKEDLKEVLREQNEAMKGRRDAAPTTFLAACFGAHRHVDLSDENELERMAYWIFERFAEEDKGSSGSAAFDDDLLMENDTLLPEQMTEAKVAELRQELDVKMSELTRMKEDIAKANAKLLQQQQDALTSGADQHLPSS